MRHGVSRFIHEDITLINIRNKYMNGINRLFAERGDRKLLSIYFVPDVR